MVIQSFNNANYCPIYGFGTTCSGFSGLNVPPPHKYSVFDRYPQPLVNSMYPGLNLTGTANTNNSNNNSMMMMFGMSIVTLLLSLLLGEQSKKNSVEKTDVGVKENSSAKTAVKVDDTTVEIASKTNYAASAGVKIEKSADGSVKLVKADDGGGNYNPADLDSLGIFAANDVADANARDAAKVDAAVAAANKTADPLGSFAILWDLQNLTRWEL